MNDSYRISERDNMRNLKSQIDSMNINREAGITLPPNFEIYAKNKNMDKYELNLPTRLAMNNPKINPSFQSHEVDLNGLRMDRIQKRSLNVPDDEEFKNIDFELNMRKKEVEDVSNKFNFLRKQHETLVRGSNVQR